MSLDEPDLNVDINIGVVLKGKVDSMLSASTASQMFQNLLQELVENNFPEQTLRLVAYDPFYGEAEDPEDG